MTQNVENRSDIQISANSAKVRKVIEDICRNAGATVFIEQRAEVASAGAADEQLRVTYTGDKPMPYDSWFRLVDSIDEALESSSSDLIDWESSELSGESQQQRSASWKIASAAADGKTAG
jgi:hypothetical protein